MAMLDFLLNNRELATAVASVIVAVLGLFTALLKRNTTHTIRRETVVPVLSSPGDERSPRSWGASAIELAPGVSVVGEYLCVQDNTLQRSQVTSVTLGRGIGGLAALLAVPLLGFLALGAWGSGERGAAALLGVFALAGAVVTSMKNVYVVTPQGSRRIAKSLFPGEAKKVRNEILRWRSG
jgi:hypothetical protein